jgi:lipopolysaccharide/colanic/teichoic acid biosynthesis glycosyltransferase
MLKRIFDFVFALIALIVFAPLILVLMALIAVKMGIPVFFVQERPGLNGKAFNMIKFRTMSDERDASGQLLPDDVRLGRFGRTLRATSLDELPELWNVVKGEMSLVGPRPLLMQYLPLYSTDQARRHLVRPGITGWAQVSGRNALSWDEKFALDLWYVENQNLWLDIRILFRTVAAVFGRRGISADGSATMPAFTGNGDEGPSARG